VIKLICTLLTVSTLFASARPWRNTDGSRSLEGEFVKRDATALTILLKNGKEVRLDLTKLHPADRTFLDTNHPVPREVKTDAFAVFDSLKLGESKDQVIEKLKNSELVLLTIPENLLGRTGLNGVFQLKQKVSGIEASLYFEWSDTNELKEVQIRTAAVTAAEYPSKLAPCWQKFTEQLTERYGRPLQAVATIDLKSVTEGTMLSSHVWKVPSGGSTLLGIGCEAGKYQIVTRLTAEEFGPAGQQAPASPAGPKFDF